MCKYLAFKGRLRAYTLMYKYLAFKEAPNNKCNVQVLLLKGTQTAVVMSKYLALKGAPNSKCDVKSLAFKEAANSNCDMLTTSRSKGPQPQL